MLNNNLYFIIISNKCCVFNRLVYIYNRTFIKYELKITLSSQIKIAFFTALLAIQLTRNVNVHVGKFLKGLGAMQQFLLRLHLYTITSIFSLNKELKHLLEFNQNF